MPITNSISSPVHDPHLLDVSVERAATSASQLRELEKVQLVEQQLQQSGDALADLHEQLANSSQQHDHALNRMLKIQAQLQALPHDAPDVQQRRQALLTQLEQSKSLLNGAGKRHALLANHATRLVNQVMPKLDKHLAGLEPQQRQQLLQPLQLAVDATQVGGDQAIDTSWDTSDRAFADHITGVVQETYTSNEEYGKLVGGFAQYFSDMSGFKREDFIGKMDDKGKYEPTVNGDSGMAIALGNKNRESTNKVITNDITEADFNDISQKMFGDTAKNDWMEWTPNADGKTGTVRIKTNNPLYNSIKNEPAALENLCDGDGKCDNNDVGVWRKTWDLQISNASELANSLAQKLSRANSVFDNLIKVLSSTILSLLQIDQGFWKL
jgi:hypothetical protein